LRFGSSMGHHDRTLRMPAARGKSRCRLPA
jgi:hypothetical protein